MDCNIMAWHLSSCVHLKHAAELIYMVFAPHFLIVNNRVRRRVHVNSYRRLTGEG